MKVPVGTNIYLKFGTKMQVPVNPDQIEITHPSENVTHNVLGVGEIVVPRKPGLTEIQWDSFLPGEDSDPYVSDYIAPEEFIVRDKGGEPGDLYYSITLKEYRDYSPEVVEIVRETPSTAQGALEGDKVIEATVTEERPVETPVARVGASVIANGTYCNDEYGSKPHGTASGLSTTITRMNPGTPYPIHVGYYGWMQESSLQIVG